MNIESETIPSIQRQAVGRSKGNSSHIVDAEAYIGGKFLSAHVFYLLYLGEKKSKKI